MTPDRTRQERWVFRTLVIDAVLMSLVVAAAVASGSLTMAGDALRGTLMTLLLFWNYSIMRRVSRGGFRGLEFGAVKAEHLMTVLMAAMLLVSAAWLLGAVAETLLAARPAAGPSDLAVAAVAGAMNTAFNLYAWLMLRATRSAQDGESFRTQYTARRVMLLSSLTFQTMLTAAMLSPDPETSIAFDAAGALIATGFILRECWRMLRRSIPVLLDASAGAAIGDAARAAVEGAFGAGSVQHVRSRTEGNGAVVQVRFVPPDGTPAAVLPLTRARLEAELLHAVGPLKLSLQPVERITA